MTAIKGVDHPWGIAFVPDGSMLVTERPGRLRVVRNAVVDPTPLTPQVRQMINQIDDKLPIFSVTTLDEQMRNNLDQERLIAQLVSFFGALALILACIGLYGVMAHGVARRTNEIGIRMALGARALDVTRMVLTECWLLIGIGVVAGVITALAAGRYVAAVLFGLQPTDVVTLAGATFLAAVLNGFSYSIVKFDNPGLNVGLVVVAGVTAGLGIAWL